MPVKSGSRKHGTPGGSPRRSRTAKVSRISRRAVKSRRACQGGGWGRLSDDGPGQNNPVWSEGPWGRAAVAAQMAVLHGLHHPDSERAGGVPGTGSTKGGCKPRRAKGTPGAGLTGDRLGKAPSDRPALKPYWGKPAVRNFRGDDGDVGIIRSPVRAIVLPDTSCPAVRGADAVPRSSDSAGTGSHG